MEGEPEPLSYLEKLKIELQNAKREHEYSIKLLDKNPKDSELRMNIDRTYDRIGEIERQIAVLEKNRF